MYKIPVFYDARQSVLSVRSFSPSARKPAEVVASWLSAEMPIEILKFDPVLVTDFYEVHDKPFVDRVLNLSARNGFGNFSPAVAESLAWTSGSMVAAARHAVSSGKVASSPTSGFHHAHWSRSEGYCTFNGLALAAAKLLDDGLNGKVGILDIDFHYGNGTQYIINRTGLKNRVSHWTFGRDSHVKDIDSCSKWLETLEYTIRSMANDGCTAFLYQAGADPHESDSLGGVMTTEQMYLRDRIVFTTLAHLGLPVAWNLAGGYQSPLSKVILLHDATMKECVAAYLTS